MTDRLPPHAAEAEQGVLGCVMLSPAECMNVLLERRVAADWFYDLRHQIVFKAMLDLHEKRDVPVDEITLRQRLKDTGKLDEVGGDTFIMPLRDTASSASQLPYYLDLVREKFIVRQLISRCTELVGKAYDHDGKIDTLLAEAEHEIESLSGHLMERKEWLMRDVLHKLVLPQLEEHYHRGSQTLRGLSTGLNYLDKLVRGIRSNYYYVVAARPGDGKTSFGTNLVEHIAGQGHAVGVFTLEMTMESLGGRMLFSVADVNSGNFEQGYATKEDFEKLTSATHQLAKQKIYLDADPDQTIDMIAAKARRWVKEYDIKLFVLDYLQLLDEDTEKYRNDRVQALRRISKKIVSLKNKLNVPWLVLAQMNRNIETAEVKRAPQLSDLKECGAIEQDSDVVMFLYNPLKVELEDSNGQDHKEQIQQVMQHENEADPNDWPRRVNAIVAKNRYGPTGKVELLFQKNRCRFHDWTLWKQKHGLEALKEGERPKALGLPTNEEMGLGKEDDEL